jgi:hypothetical protein
MKALPQVENTAESPPDLDRKTECGCEGSSTPWSAATAPGLSQTLRRHLRKKRQELGWAGFAEAKS